MKVPTASDTGVDNISDDSSQDECSQIRGLEEDQGIYHNEEVVVSPKPESDDDIVTPVQDHSKNAKLSTMMTADSSSKFVNISEHSEHQLMRDQPGNSKGEDIGNQSTETPIDSEYEEALSLPANISYPPSSPPAYQSPPTMPKSEETKGGTNLSLESANHAARGTLNDLIMSKVALPFQQMMKRAGRSEHGSDSDSQEYSDSDPTTVLDFNQSEQQLFSFVDAYRPEEIRPRPLLRLFIMDYMPAIGDIDAMIKIPRPDEVEDNIGITQLDEPAIQQSDPTILAMQLRRTNKEITTQSDTPVKRLERADKSTHEIDKWISSVKELHRSRPQQSALQFAYHMPDIESFMQEFDPEFEKALDGVKLPTAELDVDLDEYADICLGLLDIPVHYGRIQSLHCLFSLYREFKNSQHFKNLAQNATKKRENIDMMEL